MKSVTTRILTLLCFSLFFYASDAQLSGLKNKLKKAAKSVVEDELGLEKKEAETTQPETNTSDREASNSSVQGKKLKPADVDELIGFAIDSYKKEEYSDSRFQLRESHRNIDIEIGYKILEMMPESTLGLDAIKENDGIVGSEIGLVGLVINREYGQDEKRITATIGNNSTMGAYMASYAYSTNDENQKSVMVQDYRGTLTFDGENTYQLGVPFAQSSVFVLNCEGFSGEEEVMDAVQPFTISDFEDLLQNDETNVTDGKDALAYLTSAKEKYSEKDLEGTRFQLQSGLVKIDEIIGQKVLEMLPNEIEGLTVVSEEDEYVGSGLGFAGVYINRTYSDEAGTTKIEISMMDDSPAMAMVSTFLSSPLVGMTGNKSVKIDGYRGMMEDLSSEETKEFNISIPNNQSLLTMRFINMPQSQVNTAANEVPVGEIFNFTK